MIEVFFFSIILMLSLYGYGALSRFFLVGRFLEHEKLIVGLYLVSHVALVVNFFSPINQYASLLILFVGLGCAYRFYEWPYQRVTWPKMLLALFVLLLICGYGLSNNLYSDITAYHLPTLMRIQESKIVIGLANLQDRFGYNSLFHLGSVVTNPFLRFESSNDFSSIIFMCVFLIAPFFYQGATRLCAIMVRICALCVWGKSTFLISLGLPATDMSSGILTILILEKLMQYLQDQKIKQSDVELLAVFFLFAVQIKLSQLFLIFPLVWVLYRLRFMPRLSLKLALFFIFVSIPWVLRTYLLSGCLVFPLPMTCAPRWNWSMPMDEVLAIKAIIQSWARVPLVAPEQVGAFTEWFPLWIARQLERDFFISWLATTGIFVSCLAVFRVFKISRFKAGEEKHHSYFLLSLVPVFLFWFWQAPDLRFLYGPFLFTQGYFFSKLYTWFVTSALWKKGLHAVAVIVALVFLQDFLRIMWTELMIRPVFATRFVDSDRPAIIPLVSNHGLHYFVPNYAKNGEESGCWLEHGTCANIHRPLLLETSWGPYRVLEYHQ